MLLATAGQCSMLSCASSLCRTCRHRRTSVPSGYCFACLVQRCCSKHGKHPILNQISNSRQDMFAYFVCSEWFTPASPIQSILSDTHAQQTHPLAFEKMSNTWGTYHMEGIGNALGLPSAAGIAAYSDEGARVFQKAHDLRLGQLCICFVACRKAWLCALHA